MIPELSYVICTAPRSGSWMLCSLLAQTGIAGTPAEFFGPTLNEEFASNRNVVHAHDVREYMERVLVASTTGNGVFGTKLTAPQTVTFIRRASEHRGSPFVSLKEALAAEFGQVRYLWLTRENKVAQAISFYRAIANQVWQQRGDRAPQPARLVPYDHFAIQRCYQECVMADAYWKGYFERHRIVPHRVVYEALTADYAAETYRILAFFELPTNVVVRPPETAKLAGAESTAWEQEFRAQGRIPEDVAIPPERFWAPY